MARNFKVLVKLLSTGAVIAEYSFKADDAGQAIKKARKQIKKDRGSARNQGTITFRAKLDGETVKPTKSTPKKQRKAKAPKGALSEGALSIMNALAEEGMGCAGHETLDTLADDNMSFLSAPELCDMLKMTPAQLGGYLSHLNSEGYICCDVNENHEGGPVAEANLTEKGINHLIALRDAK